MWKTSLRLDSRKKAGLWYGMVWLGWGAFLSKRHGFNFAVLCLFVCLSASVYCLFVYMSLLPSISMPLCLQRLPVASTSVFSLFSHIIESDAIHCGYGFDHRCCRVEEYLSCTAVGFLVLLLLLLL